MSGARVRVRFAGRLRDGFILERLLLVIMRASCPHCEDHLQRAGAHCRDREVDPEGC